MEDNAAARQLIRSHFWGVLSTLSKKYPGYPFGSVVPVCPDYTGMPLILISKLAQHTQNIQAHNKVALTLVDSPGAEVQTDARATLLAEALALPEVEVAAAAERYYRYFPKARGYHTELDFLFYRLEVSTVRFIGGFGRIHWLDAKPLTPNPFTPEQEGSIIQHMNEDHGQALRDYWRHAGLATQGDLSSQEDKLIEMVAMDAESLVLRQGGQLATIPLPTPVGSFAEARACLVAMAKQAREGAR